MFELPITFPMRLAHGTFLRGRRSGRKASEGGSSRQRRSGSAAETSAASHWRAVRLLSARRFLRAQDKQKNMSTNCMMLGVVDIAGAARADVTPAYAAPCQESCVPCEMSRESTPTVTPLGRSLSHWTQSRPSMPPEPTLRTRQLESSWRSACV